MGLSLVVGLLAQQKKELDAEEFEEFESIYENLNTVLKQNGLSPHHEPATLAKRNIFEVEMIGYGGLHYVRRLASHLVVNGSLPPPTTAYQSDLEDNATDALFARLERNGFKSRERHLPIDAQSEMYAHLILHSDCQGFYVPSDFEDVAFDYNEPELGGLGGMVGSSIQLLRECELLAAKIELPPDLHHDSDELWEFSDAPAVAGPLWQVYGIEAFGLTRLIAACRVSIRSGAALAFA